jgi:alkyl hydroperoxide reductase subunit AhpC
MRKKIFATNLGIALKNDPNSALIKHTRIKNSAMLPVSVVDPNKNIKHQFTTNHTFIGREIRDRWQ